MIWINSLVTLAVVLAIAAIAAVFSPLAAFGITALALIVVVLINALNTSRLHDWLQAPQVRQVPEASGAWGDMFDRLARFVGGEQQARDDLADQIEQIRESLDRLPDAVVVLDSDNSIQWCNSPAEDLLEIGDSRRPITQFIRHPEFGRYLAEGRFEKPLEIELGARAGRVYEVRVHDTEDDMRLLISRDITDQAMLNQMRSDFVDNVSHEIRTPVTVIGGFAETMLDITLPPDKQREYLDTIVHNSRTMQRLVEDLLTLSSLEATGTEGLDEEINLRRLFDDLTGETRDLSSGRHEITSGAPDNVSIIGRLSEIESAVRNFLTNAVRYTPEGGTISLLWELRKGEGRITVRDNGIGISPEHLPRLTERFYRVDRGRSRATGGTGLGLAIVKRIANRHDATLDVESELGTGSAFSLILPAARVRAT
ncbi:MAG: phosphate regulon sensor histidine kinase PhoR [Burkholderiaceae bacterium]